MLIKVYKSILVVLFVMFTIACPLGEMDYALSGDSEDFTDTALSSGIGSGGLLPTTTVKIEGKFLNGKQGYSLEWTPILYAIKYKVYTSLTEAGPYTFLAETSSSEYRYDLTEEAKAVEKSRFFKVSGLNVVNKESELSMPVQGVISFSAYAQQVEYLNASKGENGGIQIDWTSNYTAFSYEILRAKQGAGLEQAEVAYNKYIPINHRDPRLYWKDSAVNDAVLYDYWITCVTEDGQKGIISDIAKGGYSVPTVKVAFGNTGSIRGANFSYAEILWEVPWCMENHAGLIKDSDGNYDISNVTPNEFSIIFTDNPSSQEKNYGDLSVIIDSSATFITSGEAQGGEISVGTGDLYTNSANGHWTIEGNYFAKIQTAQTSTPDNPLFLNTKNYLARIKSTNAGSWNKDYFFRIVAQYPNNISATASPMQKIRFLGNSATNNIEPPAGLMFNAETKTFSWTASTTSGVSYTLLKKKRTAFEFEIVTENILELESLQDTLTLQDEDCYYAVIATKDGKSSQMSFPIAVKLY